MKPRLTAPLFTPLLLTNDCRLSEVVVEQWSNEIFEPVALGQERQLLAC